MNTGTPIVRSLILLKAQFPIAIPHAENKITAANYAMISHVAGSRRSQARTRITQK